MTMYRRDPTVRGGWRKVEVLDLRGNAATVRDGEYGKPYTISVSVLRDERPVVRDWGHLRTEEA